MSNAKIIGIMACAKNGVVGKDGAVPWRYSGDLQHFRSTIGNSPIIMGRKSFEVMPQSFLKDRTVIVFSRKKRPSIQDAIFVASLEGFFALSVLPEMPVMYMIGGAQLANFFLDNKLISEFILTRLNRPYTGDAVLKLKAFDGWSTEVIKETANYAILIKKA